MDFLLKILRVEPGRINLTLGSSQRARWRASTRGDRRLLSFRLVDRLRRQVRIPGARRSLSEDPHVGPSRRGGNPSCVLGLRAGNLPHGAGADACSSLLSAVAIVDDCFALRDSRSGRSEQFWPFLPSSARIHPLDHGHHTDRILH